MVKDIQYFPPNSSILLYNGLCTLGTQDPIETHLEFFWDSARAQIRFELTSADQSFIEKVANDWLLKIRIHEFPYSTDSAVLKGSLYKSGLSTCVPGFLIGDHDLVTSAPVKFAQLHIFNGVYYPNFPDGQVFQYGPWIITLGQVNDYGAMVSAFRNSGGMTRTHIATLEKSDGSHFNLTDTETVALLLSTFLSFCYGRKVAAIYSHGFDSKAASVQQLWRPRRLSTYPFSKSWFGATDSDLAKHLFKQFSKTWDADQAVLFRLVQWYVDCVAIDASVENTLILGQAALEYAFFQVYVNQKGIFKSGDSHDKLAAADRLRLLLDHLGLPLGVPDDCTALHTAMAGAQWHDAPHMLTDIRNKIVHPRNIDKIAGLNAQHREEAVSILLLYFELTILRLIDYQGTFVDRTMQSSKETQVCWARAGDAHPGAS